MIEKVGKQIKQEMTELELLTSELPGFGWIVPIGGGGTEVVVQVDLASVVLLIADRSSVVHHRGVNHRGGVVRHGIARVARVVGTRVERSTHGTQKLLGT